MKKEPTLDDMTVIASTLALLAAAFEEVCDMSKSNDTDLSAGQMAAFTLAVAAKIGDERIKEMESQGDTSKQVRDQIVKEFEDKFHPGKSVTEKEITYAILNSALDYIDRKP